MSMDDVRVHRNSAAPAGVGALAYAQGSDIHLAPGQERHLPHEAWHVVQQRQDRVRPTASAGGVAINDDPALEQEADAMGAKAASAAAPDARRRLAPCLPCAARPRPLAKARSPEGRACATTRRTTGSAPATGAWRSSACPASARPASPPCCAEEADWFHYSVDFRIGTRYMGEHIVDNFKREAMRNPFLRQLLRSDSIYIASNITFHNLEPLSTYLGKPGDPAKGGIPFDEYIRRQRQHRSAEISATRDALLFIDKAGEIYGYDHFVCDTSGSLCEVVDPDDPADPVMTDLAGATLPVWFRGTEADLEALTSRFEKAPKPMYYPEGFLTRLWHELPRRPGRAPEGVDPDDFIRHGFRALMAHRLPRYAAMAARWGVTVEAAEVAAVRDPQDFDALIGRGAGPPMTHAHGHHDGHGHHHAHRRRTPPAPAPSASPPSSPAASCWSRSPAASSPARWRSSPTPATCSPTSRRWRMAWLAFRFARRPADARRTYGFDRLSVLAAFVNGLALFARGDLDRRSRPPTACTTRSRSRAASCSPSPPPASR